MAIHQDVCDELGITRKELADKLGISKSTIDTWSDSTRMSNTARVAMELMIENHRLKKILQQVKAAQDALFSFAPYDGSNAINKPSETHREVIDRLKFVIKEYELNTITAASRLGGKNSLERLDKILTYQIYPESDFLHMFASCFGISFDWLCSGEGGAFEVPFLTSDRLSDINSSIYHSLNKIYIVNCENNAEYTKVVVKDWSGRYDILRTDFCIGKYYIMDGKEIGKVYELRKFYFDQSLAGCIVQLSKADYDKLVSQEHYIENILNRGKTSYILYDLFHLDESVADKYGDFYLNLVKELRACVDIARKQEREQRK